MYEWDSVPSSCVVSHLESWTRCHFGPGVSKEIGDRSAVRQSVVAHRLDSATSDR